jgi:hypothetical protein
MRNEKSCRNCGNPDRWDWCTPGMFPKGYSCPSWEPVKAIEMRDFRKEQYDVFQSGEKEMLEYTNDMLNEIDRLRKEIKNMKKRDKFDDEYERQLQKYGTFYGFPDGFEEEE